MKQRGHFTDGDELREGLVELGREIEAGLTDHPEPEVLLAYQRGDLQADEADRVEEHITFCRACGDLTLAIPGFLHPEGEPHRERDQAAKDTLPSEATAPVVVAELRQPSSVVPPPRRKGPAAWLPLAASLVMGLVLGWGGRWLASKPSTERLSARVVIGELPAAARGSSQAEIRLVFTPGAEVGVVVVTPDEALGEGPFELRVLGLDGRVLFTQEGALPTPFGTFVLTFDRKVLPPGTYRVEVLAGAGHRSVVRRELRVLEQDVAP